MRRIRETLRLFWGCGLTQNKIHESCSISRWAVAEYISRARLAGLSWPLPEGLDDAALEKLLFPPRECIAKDERCIPEWSYIAQQLHRKGVTLRLLWEEYMEQNPKGYQYSRFCDLYQEWAKKIDYSMRQEHKAGEKTFVDFAGKTVPITDRKTGEVKQAHIFVAALGASSYTFAKAFPSEDLYSWTKGCIGAFEYFGGVTELLIPDNAKAAVTKPCRYEPGLNPTFLDMAQHYGTAVLPARVRHPKDKAKVEMAVGVVTRWILAALRNHTFFSIGQLNDAIAILLDKLNKRPFQKMPGSRYDLFCALDKPALKPLPLQCYEYAEFKKAKVNIDYHVDVDGHWYSVPHQLVRSQVDVRVTATTVEFFNNGRRVASHIRSGSKGRHSTIAEHMPKSHRQYKEWSPARIVNWAMSIGGQTAKLVEIILSSKRHPEQGYRSCLGLLRLGKLHGNERLEQACARALLVGAHSYTSVKSILSNNLERAPLPEPAASDGAIAHLNIRGPNYFVQSKEDADVTSSDAG
jgi:transposase